MTIDETAEKLLHDHYRWISDNLRLRNINGYEVKRFASWTGSECLNGECIALIMNDADRQTHVLHAFPQHKMIAVQFKTRKFLNGEWNSRVKAAAALLSDLGYDVKEINVSEYTMIREYTS